MIVHVVFSFLLNDADGAHLWCHVLHGAHRADGNLLLHAHRQPKVSQLHTAIRAYEYILQLDIPA